MNQFMLVHYKSLSDQDRSCLVEQYNCKKEKVALSFSVFHGADHCGPEWFDNNEYKLPHTENDIFYEPESIKKFVSDSIDTIKDIIHDQSQIPDESVIVSDLLDHGYHVDNYVERDFSIVFSVNYARVAICNAKNKGSIVNWLNYEHNSPIIYDTLFARYHCWAKKYFYYDYFTP